jgi:FKBP-type peptidyl-prolyl cis-trans isomerase FklB
VQKKYKYINMKILHFFAILSVIALVSCNNTETKKETVALNSDVDSVSYALGVDIANNLKRSFDNLNADAIAMGLSDILVDSAAIIDDGQVRNIIQTYMQKQQEAKAKPLIEAGQKFLDENGKRDGVTTTASGLQYEVLKEGNGPKPSATDVVTVNYKGTLIDGTVFDSNEGKDPISFPINGVIAGWTEALQLMNVGSKYKLFIPYNLAYGERGAGQTIKPYSTLIFEVELLDTKPQEQPKK